MAPIIAGLAVGIGVPILLFYVYGVVPVSLCRSGGCGVSTNRSGVRFDFFDENEMLWESERAILAGRNVGGEKLFHFSSCHNSRSIWLEIIVIMVYHNIKNMILGCLDAASIDVASHRGNPSIGEASLSLGSGSQLEKLGRENDRESASNVALAGTSLAGSIASSVLPGGQR